MDAVKGADSNWNTPIHLSPTQRGLIYIGAQFLIVLVLRLRVVNQGKTSPVRAERNSEFEASLDFERAKNDGSQ